MYTYLCGFQSKMHGDVCTTKVEVISSEAVIWHDCVDGKRKRLNLEGA